MLLEEPKLLDPRPVFPPRRERSEIDDPPKLDKDPDDPKDPNPDDPKDPKPDVDPRLEDWKLLSLEEDEDEEDHLDAELSPLDDPESWTVTEGPWLTEPLN